ncbi:MAG TPA: alpha/beta hydrolase family protein [Ignavibacteria bacterium]
MKKILLTILFIICFNLTFSQNKATVVTDSIYSQSLKSYSKFNVILPPNYYLNTDERFIVIYLLHGYTGDFNDWVSRTNVAKYATNYNFIIVTPDAKNSWYVNAINKKNSNYEDYIIKELIPHIGKIYRALDTRHGRVIAGLSMGGYGALRLALKYPNTFFYSGAFSGAFHILSAITNLKDTKSNLIKDAIEIFGDKEGDFWNDCDIFKLIDKSNNLVLPYIYLSCGKDDVYELFDSNRKVAEALQKKKIMYEYHELPGSHNWVYWDKAIKDFLYKISIYDNLKP